MLSTGLDRLGQTVLGVALLASLAAPTAVHAPSTEARRALHACHGPAPTRWIDAERVYAEVDRRARALDAPLRARIAREILAEAARAGLDPRLVLALIHVESRFDPRAVSSAGAIGLMQLLESTMSEVAARGRLASANPLDPVANVQAGVRYLAALLDAFDDAELALMAYNAGPGRIRRYLRAGEVPERFWTYPRKVAREMDRLGGSLAPEERAGALLAVNDLPMPRG